MRDYIFAVMILFSAATVCVAQHGTAESGYYPMDYGGSTFTGTVTATNNATREVTLSFTNPKNGKTETFIGVLREGYTVKLSNGILHEIKPSEMRLGARFKVYYQPETNKVGVKRSPKNL
jgi:hypothetical protein